MTADPLEIERRLCLGFVRKTLRKSMRIVRSCHEDDIEEILQDTYLAYLEHLRKQTPIQSARGYFFEILRYHCYRYMKRLPIRECRKTLLEDEPPTAETPETECLTAEQWVWGDKARQAVRTVIHEFLNGPDWKRGMQNIGVAAFTAREKEVLLLFLDGNRFKEIGYQLGISLKTAHAHYESVCRKIRASHPVEVVKFAIREQLITV